MFCQVQDQPRPADLQVAREVGTEAVLPILGKAKEAGVERARFRQVEDAHNRNGPWTAAPLTDAPPA